MDREINRQIIKYRKMSITLNAFSLRKKKKKIYIYIKNLKINK